MRTGADAIAETLSAHDVPVVFTLCGDHTNPLLDAIDRAGIRIVDTRDERGAAWMAAGWAYATARTGVVITSNTPALLNAATGLADADACGIPVLCLTGGVAQADRGAGHPGEADQAAIAAPWSRWTGTARSAEEAAGRTARAFAATRERRPGVAVLDLPLDVQHGRADVPVAPPIRPARPGPSPAELETLVDALDRAERPVLLAGSRAWFSGASAGLRSLIERAALPTFTTRAARGLIPDSHEHALGFPSLLGEPAQIAFGEADLALVVGADLDLMVAGGAFHDGCTLVRVDSDPGAFALGRKADVAIEGNEAAVVGEVSARARARAPTDWNVRLRAARDARRATLAPRATIRSTPMHPGRLVAEVAALLPDDAMVCVDAGELALWALDAIPAMREASMHVSSSSRLGALGMGLPFAIGMKAAFPDRPAVVLAGDGSFGFTAMELETSARHGLPVAVVVGNDAGWGIVRHLQRAHYGRSLASDLPPTPYELLAEMAGGVGDAVRTPQQLVIALTNAIVAGVPSVINVHVDPDVTHEAIPLVAAMFAPREDPGA